ncbi:MAG: NADH-quinone oxidoreductase subunit M [Candidatus Bathyarchaeota archaeon]|nr:NADH-quinone oxidoreductase subunit M [Candidatus Bathyarchaeota archaeon]
MLPILLSVLLLPTLAVPFIYLAGKKSAKSAAILLAVVSLATLALTLTTVPTMLDSPQHNYVESYDWIPVLNSDFTLYVDGISLSMVIITMVLMAAAALYSINYMKDKKNLPVYYTLLTLLFIGLVGVFITSNLLFFYFCWELMLVPAFFLIGGWGYKESYKASFKFFVFTHAGAVFVLLGIGAIYMVTGSIDLFQAEQLLLTANTEIVKWILLALTAGFAVKMAIFPVHLWLPDAYSEAPAPMSALLGGVLTSAGAYAVIRVSMETVFPAVAGTDFGTMFLHALALLGVISAFFGSFVALVETDIKRIIAYSSISHMGYILFGVSLFAPMTLETAMTGTVLHIVTHAFSKGLFFFTAGAVMQAVAVRNIKEMGGLGSKMPITGISSAIAALSLGGTPPFACFISEFLIFMGAFQMIQVDSFYIIPTALMLAAAVLSLAYGLRFISHVFLGTPKTPIENKKLENKRFMLFSMILVAAIVVIIGIFPSFFVDIINAATSTFL